MAKGARPKHLQARVAFLNEAAQHLAAQTYKPATSPRQENDASPPAWLQRNAGLATWLCTSMRTVAKRSQIRLDRDVKRGFCKTCSTPLVEGSTSSAGVANASKGGKKPWATVETVTCTNCGTTKRFPVGARRQSKKQHRVAREKDAVATDQVNDERPK